MPSKNTTHAAKAARKEPAAGSKKSQPTPATSVQVKKVANTARKEQRERGDEATPLPTFPYFPCAYGWADKAKSGSYSPAVFMSNKAMQSVCECCGKVRSHILNMKKSPGLLGTKVEVSVLCPWCIASGEAAKRFNGCFVTSVAECDDDEEGTNNNSDGAKGSPPNKPNSDDTNNVSAAYMEIMERTPPFQQWSGCQWMTHCSDGCEYHGELRMDDIDALKSSTLRWFARENPELFGGEAGDEGDNEGFETLSDEDDMAEDSTKSAKEARNNHAEALAELNAEEEAEGVDTEEAEEGVEVGEFVMPSDAEIRETLHESYDGPGSDPAVYKFVCRHCGEVVLNCDYT